MTRKSLTFFVFVAATAFIFGALCITSARADTIYLKDGTFFEGNILHYYEGNLHIVLASGDTLILGHHELEKVVFGDSGKDKSGRDDAKQESTPKKRSSTESAQNDKLYRSPKHTFETWKRALMKGDFDAMADCFIESARPLMLQKLREIPEEQRNQMVNDANKTDFKFGKLKVESDHASVTVTRVLNRNSQPEELNFVRENNLWKLVPN